MYLALITYTLFFAILWFTWMQVTYHDLRYCRDSFYERVCKMAQFSFMVLFSAKSREWNPYEMEKKTSQDAVIWVSAVLMASRWFLMVQYGVVAYFLWRRNRRELKDKPKGYIKYEDEHYEAVRHVLFHVAVMFVMSLVYMIVSCLPCMQKPSGRALMGVDFLGVYTDARKSEVLLDLVSSLCHHS